MSLVVNSRPSKTIETVVCTYRVSGRPIVYSFTRKDRAFNTGADSSGFLRLQITGVDVTALFTVGDSIYIQSDNGLYSLVAEVTAKAFSGGNTLITTDAVYLGSPTTGYLNFITTRPLYHVDVQLYKNTDTLVGPIIQYTPSPNGQMNVIVTSLVEAQLSAVTDFTFATPLQINNSITLPFFIKYTEVWTGSAEAQTDDSANKFNAVLGNMNLREPRIPFLYNYAECYHNAQLIKFLKRGGYNHFDLLVGDQKYIDVSRDFKTYLSFITYDAVEPFDIIIKKYQGAVLDSTTTLGPFSPPGLWDLELDEEANVNVTSMTVQVVDAGTVVEVSELLTFQYQCAKNAVKLLWRNSLGGIEEHYFEYSQQLEYTYPSGRKAKRLTMTSINISKETWDAVNELNNTADVFKENIIEVDENTYRTDVKLRQQVYLFDGVTSYGVIVIPSATNKQTVDKLNSIEIQIEYPDSI